MPAPYNYVLPNGGASFDSFLQGSQVGLALRQQEEARAAAEAKRAQQEQALRDQEEARALLSNPNATAADYARGLMLAPGLKDAAKQVWDAKTTEQQKTDLENYAQWNYAVDHGHPEVAISSMRDRIKAIENTTGAPTLESKGLAMIADALESTPVFGHGMLKVALDSHPDAKRYTEAASLREEAPDKARNVTATADKAVSDAETAKVAAKYADQNALLDIQKKGWDIRKIGADIEIARENNRIQAMNAAANREANALKKQELELKAADARAALDEKIRGKVAEAENGASAIDNMLNTIERVKKHPALRAVLGSLEGSDAYPHTLVGAPGVGTATGLVASADDRNDAIALIETLGSQAFVAQIPTIKGTGSLSDAEGKKLGASLQNLSRKQSEGQFAANLDEAERFLVKARETLSRKTGVPLAAPDTPAAGGGQAKRISTDADYNALPSGATFIAPDGTTRRKP